MLDVSAAEFATISHVCLFYLAGHGKMVAIHYGVVPIVLTGKRQAKLRHLIGANR